MGKKDVMKAFIVDRYKKKGALRLRRHAGAGAAG